MGRAPLPMTPVTNGRPSYEPYLQTPITHAMWWVNPVLIIIIVLIALVCHGCAVHRTSAGYPAPIPGCADAYIFVPKGCHLSPFRDHVEVQCPDSTTKFSNCVSR